MTPAAKIGLRAYKRRYNKKWRALHPVESYRATQKWARSHLEQSKQYRAQYTRQYNKTRCRLDPYFRLRVYLRIRMNQVLCGTKKSASTEKLVGCSIRQLKQSIERQFLPGMTWNNRGRVEGTWQLHHKKPCASFDLTDPIQQRDCFHYTNLQPLWYKDHPRGRLPR